MLICLVRVRRDTITSCASSVGASVLAKVRSNPRSAPKVPLTNEESRRCPVNKKMLTMSLISHMQISHMQKSIADCTVDHLTLTSAGYLQHPAISRLSRSGFTTQDSLSHLRRSAQPFQRRPLQRSASGNGGGCQRPYHQHSRRHSHISPTSSRQFQTFHTPSQLLGATQNCRGYTYSTS